MRRSLIQNSITSEAKKNFYKGSVVRVSASYRPSSKVVGCGGGSEVKKYFLYTGSVVRVSASSSFIAVSRLNACPQSVGPTSKLFFQLTCFSGVL